MPTCFPTAKSCCPVCGKVKGCCIRLLPPTLYLNISGAVDNIADLPVVFDDGLGLWFGEFDSHCGQHLYVCVACSSAGGIPFATFSCADPRTRPCCEPLF